MKPTPAATSDDSGSLRLPRGRRYTLYAIAIGVFVSGALWLIYHYFLRTAGPFGLRSDPLEAWWLKIHGAFSFAAIWICGVLWSVHIVRGWNMRWRRLSGGLLAAATLLLTLSGYGLYYIDSRWWREQIGILHWAIGLAAPLIFFIHWLSKTMPRRAHAPYPWPWFRKRHPR
jgi:hypothetical protein